MPPGWVLELGLVVELWLPVPGGRLWLLVPGGRRKLTDFWLDMGVGGKLWFRVVVVT